MLLRAGQFFRFTNGCIKDSFGMILPDSQAIMVIGNGSGKYNNPRKGRVPHNAVEVRKSELPTPVVDGFSYVSAAISS